tara:strand:- start:62 stop:559 length:498 start_codon:yes stop_codon:yes gene_type:complete
MKSNLTILILTLTLSSFCQSIKSNITLTDSTSIRAIISNFKISSNKLDTCDTGLGWETICLIDNQQWFGSDAGLELPKNQLDSLSISINGLKIQLETSKMFNPSFSGKISERQFKLIKTETGYTLYAFFSDGAGGYTAHWDIINDKSFRNVLSKEEGCFYWQLAK